jgi:hypothetical protein
MDQDERIAAAIRHANSSQWTRCGNYEVLTDEVEKAASDDRQYRIIRLDNGLVLVLIHDPSADEAAAALDVAVGHLNDPVRQASILPGRKEHIKLILHTRMICQDSPTSVNIYFSW